MEIRLPVGRYYGETGTRRAFAGLRLMETTYPSGLKLPQHCHTSACFSLMLQGALTENYRTRTLEAEPQSVCFNAADEKHSNVIHREGARFFIIEMDNTWIRRIAECATELERSVVFKRGELNWIALRIYREFQQPDGASELAIEGLTLEMIAASARRVPLKAEQNVPLWLKQARDLIHEHFSETLTVSYIAAEVGVHPVHLARTFRRNYSLTIGEYVRRLRIQLACDQISSSDIPFAQVAVNAGFYDQGHLTRVIKRFTDMTPARYRSLARSVNQRPGRKG